MFVMRRLILLLGGILVCVLCDGQSIEKRYSSHLTENGTIHFFRPKQLDKTVNMDAFNFDMSYHSKSDTITINCSLYMQDDAIVKELNLKSGNKTISCYSVNMLYRDVTKKGYILRITSKFPFTDVKESFNSSIPLMFCITLVNDGRCFATYKESKWKKECAQISKIINSIYY